ncbi:MAG TPA: cytochrome C, partial [Castellaniella sp.]|nr:cytochrome C [Castellaniella sp.]
MGYFMQAGGPAAAPTMHLGWGITVLSLAVVIIIFGLLVAALIRRRPPADPRALGPEPGGMTFVYVSVAVSTLALLVTLAYTLITLEAVAQPSPAPSLKVHVTAYDWWWQIRYDNPAGGPAIVTANEIHIPTGVPVKIELESADVIHSFWVPQLAGKTQAIPGQTNTQWMQADAAGVYRGQCAAFCGAQ